jgi:hypothetical protein
VDHRIAQAQDKVEFARNSLRKILPSRLGRVYVDAELPRSSLGFGHHAGASVRGSDVISPPGQSHGIRTYAASAVKYSRASRQGRQYPF